MHTQHLAERPGTSLEDLTLLDRPTVEALIGLRRTALRERVKAGAIPAPIYLSSQAPRWRAGDIRRYLADPLRWDQSKAIDAIFQEVR